MFLVLFFALFFQNSYGSHIGASHDGNVMLMELQTSNDFAELKRFISFEQLPHGSCDDLYSIEVAQVQIDTLLNNAFLQRNDLHKARAYFLKRELSGKGSKSSEKLLEKRDRVESIYQGFFVNIQRIFNICQQFPRLQTSSSVDQYNKLVRDGVEIKQFFKQSLLYQGLGINNFVRS